MEPKHGENGEEIILHGHVTMPVFRDGLLTPDRRRLVQVFVFRHVVIAEPLHTLARHALKPLKGEIERCYNFVLMFGEISHGRSEFI